MTAPSGARFSVRSWRVEKLLHLDAAALTACKAFTRDSAYLHPDDDAAYGVSFLAEFNTSQQT